MTVLAIDATNLLVRCVKAMERTNLEVGGVATGGVMTFINSLSRYVREVQPDYLVACWDGGSSHIRTAIFEDYKSHRDRPSTAFNPDSPFELAKEFLRLSNIQQAEQEGVEADDLVAAYWRENELHQFVILSGDKDFLQLLDEDTRQIRPGGGVEEWWDAERVETELGCKPEHLPYVLALTGDKSDSVPGIPGFGYKTACKVLSQYEWDFDGLLAASHPKVFGHEEDVRRNLSLVNLRAVATRVEPLVRFEPRSDRMALSFCQQYQLRTIAERLRAGTLWAEPEKEIPEWRK